MTSLPLAGAAQAPDRVIHSEITGLGVHRPPHASSVVVDTRAEKGVTQRIKGEQGATTPWLALGAARAALKAARIAPADIQLVIVGTTSPDVLWPSTACLVQTELGLPMVASFDLYAAEAGALTALAVADRFVRSGTRAALVIGAEAERQLVDLPGQGTHRGHAAGALILGPAGDAGILASAVGGAAGTTSGAAPSAEGLNRVVDACLTRAGVTLREVDLVIGEQASPEVTAAWAARSGIPMERVILDPPRYADALAAAPLLALFDAVAAGRLRRGATMLLFSSGSGPAWAAAAVRWGGASIAEW